MDNMTRRGAAIYCRISQDREGAGLGVERQRSDCEALAQKLGWTVMATYIDNDLSAYSGKPRPGYRSLLNDLDAGIINGVIVWHTDRLHRSPRELEEYVALCDRRKITTQTVKAGELDLATPSGRAVARTLGAWARFEVEHKSERTKRAQLQAAQAGKWLGGAPPLGWNLRADDGSATLDRPAARRIAKASTDVLTGISLGSIVAAWNEAGFLTSTGRRWNYATLRQVLSRARNAGLIEYNGEIVAQSTWPPIVTEDTWRSLCALLADPDRRRSQSNRARWLLAGIAVCGKEGCGAPMRSATATSRNGRRIVYRCTEPGTGHVARSAQQVDQVVNGVMGERLARADVADLLIVTNDGPNLDEVRTEAVSLRGRLAEAADSFSDGEITASQLARITKRLQLKIGEVEALLSTAARGSVLAGIADARDPAKAWAHATIERQRAIVRTLLAVTVLPIPKGASMRDFDPALVQIEWA